MTIPKMTTRGRSWTTSTGSCLGGMPTVGRPFAWPEKDGYSLHFVGQLDSNRKRPRRVYPGGAKIDSYGGLYP